MACRWWRSLLRRRGSRSCLPGKAWRTVCLSDNLYVIIRLDECMEWLNYHHLLYFWTVARAGTIARAGQELRLSQPTISNQLKVLEASLGHKLFERQGRRLALTDVGRTALRYADDI